MEVILLKDHENLGVENDLVSVKDGYGRNYLIPKGIAMIANKSNRKVWEERQRQFDRKEEKLREQLQEIIDTLKDATIKIGTKVGTTEKIFGSVTTHHLAEAIKTQTGVQIDRRKISIPEEVKTLGSYSADIDLYKDVKIQVNFEVIPE